MAFPSRLVGKRNLSMPIHKSALKKTARKPASKREAVEPHQSDARLGIAHRHVPRIFENEDFSTRGADWWKAQ